MTSNVVNLSLRKLSDEIEKMLRSDSLDEQRVSFILSELKTNKIELYDLQQTGIGRSLNNLRKSLRNENHVAQCRSILKSWKRLVETSKNLSPSQSLSPSYSVIKRKSTKDLSVERSNISPPPKKQTNQESPSKDDNSQGLGNQCLSDHLLEKLGSGLEQCSESDLAIRLKCREMLTKALHIDLSNESDSMVEIAIKIESTIFCDMNKNTSSKYRSQVRSRVYNLKDSKNPTLRIRVCNGEIDPSRFARMSADELASDEMKKARQQMTKEAIDEHQMALSGGTVTDLIKCSRCKQNQCTYNQVQTRSADEPMTTFVYCNMCGHRWKFG